MAELRTHRHESFGELAGVRAEYVWYKDVVWESSVGYSFFTTYVNEIPTFNVISHVASLGVSRRLLLGPLPMLVSAMYAWDTLVLDSSEFLTRNTASLSAALVESEMNLTQAFARYHYKDFVKAGWQFDYDATDRRNYEYLGHRFSVGGQYTLPWWALRLKYDFDVHLREYQNKNSILPSYAPGTKKRQDEEIVNVLRAELPLPRDLTLAAEYQATRSHSNIEVFDFSRNVVSLVLSWSY